MSYTRFKGSFRSTNRTDRINYYICEPESEIRAVLQFAHGWVDCFERNKALVEYFTTHGILVCGCDFIGHDLSGRKSGELPEHCGDFTKKNGWVYLVKDLRKLTQYIKKTYPGVPIYLYGHGLGSLVARVTVSKGERYDGLILSGTSGKQHFCRRSILYSRFLKFWKGPDYESALLETLMQNKVNCRFFREKDPRAWECSDPDNRIANNLGRPDAGFYTAAALRDMFYMLAMVSAKSWYESLPAEMPVLLISGEDDPVGARGKGIREVSGKLRSAGLKTTMRLYPGMRHNLQDEPDKEKVFNDVLSWMKESMND